MVWDGYIALYLFLAGLGGGAFVVGAATNWMRRPAKKIKKIAFVIAPVAVLIGTLVLVFDAKAGFYNPTRFFLLISNLNSVMSWGVIILSLFLVVSIVDLVILLATKKTPVALDVVGMVLAVTVAAYTGVLLGDAGVAFPLWNRALLPALFVVSAASSGMAAVLLIASLVASEEKDNLCFNGKAGVVLPLIEAVLLVIFVLVTSAQTGSAQQAAQASLASLLTGSYALAFWLGLVVVGLVIPLVLDLVQLRKCACAQKDDATSTPNDAKTKRIALDIVVSVCVLIGGFMLRYLIIMAAVAVAFR